MVRVIFILVFIRVLSYAQDCTFTIQGYCFLFSKKVVSNEWHSHDTIQKLYRVEDGYKVYVLTSYIYKDNGGDCNNLFWLRETYSIKNNRITFLTHYFQETGIDPIHEWRKQIYAVNELGKLILVYDKYKYYFNDEWVDS